MFAIHTIYCAIGRLLRAPPARLNCTNLFGFSVRLFFSFFARYFAHLRFEIRATCENVRCRTNFAHFGAIRLARAPCSWEAMPNLRNILSLTTFLFTLVFDFIVSLKEFFASVQRTTKTGNNRTPTDGTCYEIGKCSVPRHFIVDSFKLFEFPDNYSLPETTRSCWPVRPIPRRNVAHEPFSDANSFNASGNNAAIGVVIPTTPNSSMHHQHQNHINEQHQNILNARRNTSPNEPFAAVESSPVMAMRVPDGATHPMSIVNNFQSCSQSAQVRASRSVSNGDRQTPNNCNGNIEDRLSQIQNYIRITTSLLHSINADGVSRSYGLLLLLVFVRCFLFYYYYYLAPVRLVFIFNFSLSITRAFDPLTTEGSLSQFRFENMSKIRCNERV